MSANRHAEYPEPVNHWTLWFGMLGGAGAWAMHLVFSYSLVPAACSAGLGFLFYVGIVVFAGIAIAAGFFAWRGWNAGRDPSSAQDDNVGGRRFQRNGRRLMSDRIRFMALSGLVMSGFFLAVIIAQSVPIIMQDPCQAAGSLRI